MKVIIVNGSHRENSQSGKIAEYVKDRYNSTHPGVTADIVSLEGNPLPLWDETFWKKSESWNAIWSPISAKLTEAEAFVFVVPEWAGMVPGGVRNFFQLCGNKQLGHKPALIVSISASGNGAYPVAELRMTSTKNNHLVYIPDHVIIRNVESVFNEKEHNEDEKYIRERLYYSMNMLLDYGHALSGLRETANIDYKKYPFGM